MEAGGVSDYGSASNIHLTRIINGEQRTETINLRPTYSRRAYETKICPGRGRDLHLAQLVLSSRCRQGAICKT